MDLKPLISGKEMNNHQLKASDFYHQRCSQVVLRLKDRGCKEGVTGVKPHPSLSIIYQTCCLSKGSNIIKSSPTPSHLPTPVSQQLTPVYVESTFLPLSLKLYLFYIPLSW